jgi:diaminopimelate epimerase
MSSHVTFWKAHGLGNDYLVLEQPLRLDEARVRALCDRHRGIGGDGILEPVAAEHGADYGVRIWNPDGTIAEKSGNGLRILARWLRRVKGAPARFRVWTGACTVVCNATDEALSVEMGAPSFAAADVPVVADGELVEGQLQLAEATLTVTAVGMGNPHCVAFRDQPLDTLPWRAWGAEIERHPRFPNRTNVQFARVIDERTVEIRIWERGAGETQASGSSSCGVVAAGVRTSRLAQGRVRVVMPGGELFVTSSASGMLLEGPVGVIGRFDLAPEWLDEVG